MIPPPSHSRSHPEAGALPPGASWPLRRPSSQTRSSPGSNSLSPELGEPAPIEQDIFDYIVDYLRANTFQPSIREIAAHFGIGSTRTVLGHLNALQEKGFLERPSPRSRGLRIRGLDLGESPRVPLLSALPSSSERVREAASGETLALDSRFGASSGAFACLATDASVYEFGISAGDIVVLAPIQASELRAGALVAASRAGDPGYYRAAVAGGPSIILEPFLADRPAVLPSEVEILGAVIATIRRFATAPALSRSIH